MGFDSREINLSAPFFSGILTGYDKRGVNPLDSTSVLFRLCLGQAASDDQRVERDYRCGCKYN